MYEITVGVLTVSDRCDRKEAVDESGPNLVNMIVGGVVTNGSVVETGLVPDSMEDIERVLKDWCEKGIHLILTTGGTGVGQRDVTPEATAAVLEKTMPGIAQLMFKRSSEVTPLAALSRGIAGVRGKSLIVNLPGSKKASQECLEAVAAVIPHAVHLINGRNEEIGSVHASLGEKKSAVVVGNPAGRKRESSYPCISVATAQKIIEERVHLMRREKFISYEDAQGYVLAQDLVAKDDLPQSDVSLKDGYAVLSSDKMLERNVIAVSHAGGALGDVKVFTGHCVRVSTGAVIPPGADAVVQVEDTTCMAKQDQDEELTIVLKKLPKAGEEIRAAGSDLRMGQRLLTSGTYIDPAAVGIIAAAGVTTLRVFSRPVVAVMSTGDELVRPEETPGPGKVRDSNRATLLSLLREENYQSVDVGIVPDHPNALRDALERAFKMADVVVTTGSMSMGERDYLKDVLVADFNADICFGRVHMKPGKPTSFAVLMFEGKSKLWFGLPGNPASALVTSHLFLLPALRNVSGFENIYPISFAVQLWSEIVQEDRPHYVRAFLNYSDDYSWRATATGDQRSSRISSCVNANCLVLVPEIGKEKTPKASKVKAFLIGKSYI